MTAEVLRAAAALMRERAEAVGPADEPMMLWVLNEPTAEHVGRFGHPAVALAVADWLDAEAASFDAIENFNAITADLVREESWTVRGAAMTVSQGKDGSLGIRTNTLSPALAVARAYLGESA